LPERNASSRGISPAIAAARFPTSLRRKLDLACFAVIVRCAQGGFKMRIINVMDQLSPEIVAEFPERGMQWVKDRVETVVNETGEYVREKPTQSLFYAFAVGYVMNRLPLGRVLAGFLRLLFMALKPAILIYGAAKLYRSAQEREAPQR
jgi:hypothetical protein